MPTRPPLSNPDLDAPLIVKASRFVKAKNKNCKVCALPPEVQGLIHKLKLENQLSLRSIARKINSEYLGDGQVGLNSSNLFSHFKHMPLEAITLYSNPSPPDSPAILPVPIPTDLPKDRVNLYEKEVRVLEDLERKFEQLQSRIDLVSEEDRRFGPYINLAQEIRRSVETLNHIANPLGLVEGISINFMERKTTRSLQNLQKELTNFLNKIIPHLWKEKEPELTQALREMLYRIAQNEEQEAMLFQTDLKRALGLANVSSPTKSQN